LFLNSLFWGEYALVELESNNFKLKEILHRAEKIAKGFNERAQNAKEDGDWLIDNLEKLKMENFLSLTVPNEYGGEGLNLYEFLLVQETLAKGDGATALSIGWHLGCILENAENRTWKESIYEDLCRKISDSQAIVNFAATEKATGSPSRGGMPTTTAVKEGEKWVINGEKTFTSMAVALDYSLIPARIEDTKQKGLFLIDHSLDGVVVEETWDSIAMSATKSDDLLLKNVRINEENLISEDQGQPAPKGWYLQIPAVYIGIAQAARDYAVEFAREYSPNTLPGPIKDVPEVQRKVGEIELEIFKAREILYSVARKWVLYPEERKHMNHELAAVKHIATNSANRVVDLAMRIVGARSLSEKSPLQRYFRDVRAGLHNPPPDDAIIYMLGNRCFSLLKD
jgi:alkylation response protein AidB-like acyl-CoA dehydrogenase